MMSSPLSVELENPQAAASTASQNRRWPRRLAWVGMMFCALLVVFYLFRAPLLTGLAEAWVVSQPATGADAIVIPGGSPQNRPFAAARLFHEGIAPRILYMNVQLNPVEKLGIIPPESEITREILVSNNVPATAMVAIGTNVTSTYDESRAVRDWVVRTHATSLIIATDLFHTRRARWILQKELRGTKTGIHVFAVNPLNYRVNNWWQHEQGVIDFQNEVIKYLYYRLKY